MSTDLIIAGPSVWLRAANGRLGGRQVAFDELLRRARLTATGPVFARVLAAIDDPVRAEPVRRWALMVPPVKETREAWLAAGDIGGHLRRLGVALDPVGHHLAALCIREKAPIWSFDPTWDAAAQHLGIRRFDPVDEAPSR